MGIKTVKRFSSTLIIRGSFLIEIVISLCVCVCSVCVLVRGSPKVVPDMDESNASSLFGRWGRHQ